MTFLKQALGAMPKYGWDYCAMKGQKVLLTIAHEPRRNGQGTFPTIASLCPVPAGMVSGVPAAAPAAQAPAAPVAAPVPVAQTVDDEPLPF